MSPAKKYEKFKNDKAFQCNISEQELEIRKPKKKKKKNKFILNDYNNLTNIIKNRKEKIFLQSHEYQLDLHKLNNKKKEMKSEIQKQ